MNIIDFQCNPYYILSILNSRPISFWFAQKYGKLQRGLFPQFKINELASFPIPSCTDEQEKQLAELAKKIMLVKKTDSLSDTSSMESEIDSLVYKLYGLSEDEISVIQRS